MEGLAICFYYPAFALSHMLWRGNVVGKSHINHRFYTWADFDSNPKFERYDLGLLILFIYFINLSFIIIIIANIINYLLQ